MCSSRRLKSSTSRSNPPPSVPSRCTARAKDSDRRIAFRLDIGEALILGPDRPLRIIETATGPSPRILVRHGLEAELSRSVYYELAELALAEANEPPGIWSSGAFFPLGVGA